MPQALGSQRQLPLRQRPSWRFRHGKPIYAKAEDALNPPFTHKLVHHGWRFAPVKDGLGNSGAGHWVPPGFQPIEKEFVRPATQENPMPGQMFPRERQPMPMMQGGAAGRVAQSRKRRAAVGGNRAAGKPGLSSLIYPGAKGHLNEGPKEISGKVTISPAVKRKIREMLANRGRRQMRGSGYPATTATAPAGGSPTPFGKRAFRYTR